MNLDVDRFLEDVGGRYAKLYSEQVHRMLIAQAMGDRVALKNARDDLTGVIKESMSIASLLGASLGLKRAGEVLPEVFPERFRADVPSLVAFAAEPSNNILPRVTFDEAVEDFVSRTPVTLRRAASRTAQAISKLYSEGRVVAFAASAETAVTERVQALIVQAIKEGIPEGAFIERGRVMPGAGRLITMGAKEVSKQTEAWVESYSKMAFRTNLNTAVTAGRFRSVQDQDVKEVIPAFVFDAVGDADTRDNHEAADGLIFRVDNPVWNHIAPPLGYNCRCQARYVSLPRLRRLGRIDKTGNVIEDRLPSAAHPDLGFRHTGRPDLFIAGAV